MWSVLQDEEENGTRRKTRLNKRNRISKDIKTIGSTKRNSR
jgi:hypothetical protein